MSNYRQPQRRIPSVARAILAATLLFGVLASAFPLATSATGSLCELACCAARAPHAAGSCMNGSCQAVLKGRSKTSKIHLQFPIHEPDQLCGLPQRTARNSAVVLRGSSTALTLVASSEQSHGTRTRDASSVSISTLGKPCQPDCGTVTLGSSSQIRTRDSGAISCADKPRPPPTARHAHSLFSRAKALDALCRRSRPRGPPISSS